MYKHKRQTSFIKSGVKKLTEETGSDTLTTRVDLGNKAVVKKNLELLKYLKLVQSEKLALLLTLNQVYACIIVLLFSIGNLIVGGFAQNPDPTMWFTESLLERMSAVVSAIVGGLSASIGFFGVQNKKFPCLTCSALLNLLSISVELVIVLNYYSHTHKMYKHERQTSFVKFAVLMALYSAVIIALLAFIVKLEKRVKLESSGSSH